jgi:NADH:ubiquinone oxidoreductase subunit K
MPPRSFPGNTTLSWAWICLCGVQLMSASRKPPAIVVEQVYALHTASLMQPALFVPTARQVNWLLLVALLSLGEALYIRYLAIEYAPVSLACQAGLNTWLCATFRLTIVLFNYSVFGWVALTAALLNLLRPTILLVAVALAATAFGLVLHNANLAGLAAAMLLLSLARPAPAAE